MEARPETRATEEVNTTMVNRIKALREQSRLTQKEVARLLDMDEATVSKLESGRRPLSPEVIERLAAIFKVGSWELFLDRRALRATATRVAPTSAEDGTV